MIKKSKKLADILFVSAFLIFIAVISAVTIVKPKLQVSYYENRTLWQRPDTKFSSMLVNNYFNRWERFLCDQAAGRQTLVQLATRIDLNVIRRPVVHDVVVSEGVFLRYNGFGPVNKTLIAEQSRNVVAELSALRDVVESYGGALYYVAIPAHYTWFADKYPWYLDSREAYTDAAYEAFVSDMADAGIGLILTGMDPDTEGAEEERALYSASDHHFTFYGAYETYRSIVDRINSDGVFYLPPLVEGVNFEFYTLPNPYMGSRMRMLMNIPGITERTTIAVLNEEIPFTRADNGVVSGKPTVYTLPFGQREVVNYGIYMGGDHAETVIDTGRDLPSVLIYGESYTNAVESLMYASCGEMRSIDLRHYKEMPLIEYVEIYRPDIVLCVRGYEALVYIHDNGTVTVVE